MMIKAGLWKRLDQIEKINLLIHASKKRKKISQLPKKAIDLKKDFNKMINTDSIPLKK